LGRHRSVSPGENPWGNSQPHSSGMACPGADPAAAVSSVGPCQVRFRFQARLCPSAWLLGQVGLVRCSGDDTARPGENTGQSLTLPPSCHRSKELLNTWRVYLYGGGSARMGGVLGGPPPPGRPAVEQIITESCGRAPSHLGKVCISEQGMWMHALKTCRIGPTKGPRGNWRSPG